MHRNDPINIVQFCDDPPPPKKKKYPQNLHTPKIFVFLKTPKNIEIQNFEPKNMARAYVCMKISEYLPGGALTS